MRAILCKSYGPAENLSFEEVADPKPEADEAIVEVYSASLNFPDGLQIQGKYQFQPPKPFSPGSEVGGRIIEVGSSLSGFEIGDRVMATPGIGGVAERVLSRGETLLVLGASGGVGLAAVELGKLMGARVIAAASSDEKLNFIKQFSPDELLNYSDGEIKEKVNHLTSGRGADVIYDPVGGDLFDQACRCINWNGRLLVVGFASGRIPEYKANLSLLKGSSMVGVFLGRFRKEEPEEYEQNFHELFSFYEQGKIKPIVTESFAFEDYIDAFNVFTERRVMGKVTLELKSE